MNFLDSQADILLSYDLDIDFGTNDILLTNGIDFVKRKVFKLLITEVNDWGMNPGLGASPNLFTGMQNTRENAQLLKQFLTSRIQPYIEPFVLDIQIIPVDYDSIKIYIDLILATNILSSTPFTFDFVNGFSYTQYDEVVDKIISNKTIKFNDMEDINVPNPFLDRLRLQR